MSCGEKYGRISGQTKKPTKKQKEYSKRNLLTKILHK